MSLTSRRNGTGRVYQRRFDHEEAAGRHAAGESLAALAREYGVTASAVGYAVWPGAKARRRLYAMEWRTGRCEACGGPAMRLVGTKTKYNRDGRCLCAGCRSVARRERLRFDRGGVLEAVRCVNRDCANGERWQPPENFTRGEKFRDVRPGGIHGSCRACQTRTRRRYREARKVPCETCGTPCLPPSEKGRSGAAVPRCRACYRDSLRTPPAVTGEALQATGSAEA